MTSILTKYTTHILCSRAISRTDFDSQLMDPSLYKGLSTYSRYDISMVKVGNIWYVCVCMFII